MRKTTCCKCNHPLEPRRIASNQKYCNPCHAEYMRIHRPKHSELGEAAKMKANARSYANVYQRRGVIVPQPCEKCQNPIAEKHHSNYSQPTNVQWLCRECHLGLHKGVGFKKEIEVQRLQGAA